MHDPFDRRIGFLGVALVKGRIKNDGQCWFQIKTYLNNFLKKYHYFNGGSFLWLSLAYRYGIKNDLKLEFQRINKTYGDLPIALELDMEILQWADQNDLELLHDIFMIAALEALIQVAKKYKLPMEAFVEERSKYGNIPNTIDECKCYKRPNVDSKIKDLKNNPTKLPSTLDNNNSSSLSNTI